MAPAISLRLKPARHGECVPLHSFLISASGLPSAIYWPTVSAGLTISPITPSLFSLLEHPTPDSSPLY